MPGSTKAPQPPGSAVPLCGIRELSPGPVRVQPDLHLREITVQPRVGRGRIQLVADFLTGRVGFHGEVITLSGQKTEEHDLVICPRFHAQLLGVGRMGNQIPVDLGNSQGFTGVPPVPAPQLPDQGSVESVQRFLVFGHHSPPGRLAFSRRILHDKTGSKPHAFDGGCPLTQ